MKKNNKHIDIYSHLTQEETLEYSRGVLGNDEMYRLELHLNECELCCDALEGIENLKNPEVLLSSIRTEILPNNKKKSNLNYLAIAASISLIAVFGLSYWLLTGSTEDKTIALNTPTEILTIEAKEDKIKDKVFDAVPETTKDELKGDIIESEAETITSTTNEPEPKPTPTQKPIIRKEKAEEVPNEETLLAENSIEEEDLANSDDQIQELVAEPTDVNAGVALQSAPMAARSAKKASSDANLKLADQKEPSPIGGMTAFKAYISSNLVYPQQARDNKIRGTVVLEVTIAKDGSIKNIVVSKTIGYGCDAEAMRLISAGPKWTPAVVKGIAIESNQQVKVKFKN